MQSLRLAVGAYLADGSGSVAILGSAVLSLLAVVGIVVVDLGSVYLDKRKAQGVLDIAAELAAQDIDHAEAVVRGTLARNGITDIRHLVIVPGQYVADASLTPSARFVANATPANAVRVDLASNAELFFAKKFLPRDTVAFGVTSIGAQNRRAAISIGSRLLSLNGGLINAVLGGLLGGEVNLSLVDYRALADANIDLLDFLDALAIETETTAVTYDQLLDTDVAIGDVTAAINTAMDPNSDLYTLNAAARLAGATRNLGTSVPLSHLLDLGPVGAAAIGSGGGGLDVATSILSLLMASATAADGEHQLSLDLGASIPGLLSATVDVDVGEPAQSSPWLGVGEEDVVVRTSQIRVGIRASLGGHGLLTGTQIKLPVAVHVAPAEARIADIACSAAREPTVTVATRPGVLNAWIGDTDPYRLASFSNPAKVDPATLVEALNFVTVEGRAHVEVAEMNETNLVFDSGEISRHTVKTASTHDAAESLVTSLLGDLELHAQVGPLSLYSRRVLREALMDVLSPAASIVDDLLDTTLQLLGVNVGEADVWVNGAKCGRSGLVG